MMEYKNGVIITAHGEFCSGIQSAISLIAGEMENLRTVNFVVGDTFEIIDQSLKKAYEELKDKQNIVILTDLKGGTPFNRSVLTLGSHENVRVLSGLNFAMLYQALITDTENIDEYVEEIMEAGKEAIDVFEQTNDEDDEEEFDGI
ncbi:MAG: PTS sugar transporter subunit IIA [Tissierellia bacterium]|nr:PTS sugar transporter subunit IIA [Tissierellia bacterium]